MLTPAQQQQMLAAQGTVVNDLNNNNFSGAWNTALGTSSLYGTNYGATTQDPLLQGLESSQGLRALDPSKQWNTNLLGQYYQAFNQNSVYHGQGPAGESLGKNPYGTWGSASGIPGDITANASQEGMTPDVQRFVGARPSPGFGQRWGVPIAALALAALAPEAVGAIGGLMDAGLTSGAGAALGGGAFLGSAAGGIATDAAAAGLYGAGGGALIGGLSGGNVGRDALLGGLGGAVAGGVVGAGQYFGAPNAVSAGAGQAAGHMAQQYYDQYGNPVQMGTNVSGSNNSPWGALGTLAGGLLQGNAAGNAANAASNAANAGLQTQLGMFGTTQSGFSPFLSNGQNASNQLGNLMSGTGASQAASFQNTPGYQYALQQGMSGVNRQAAATGGLYSSNTLNAVGANQQGIASTNYQNYVQNLMQLAGLGNAAAGGIGSAATATGQGAANSQLNAGNAQAAGMLGQANVFSNALGSLGNNSWVQQQAGNAWNGAGNLMSSIGSPNFNTGIGVGGDMGVGAGGVPNAIAASGGGGGVDWLSNILGG